MSQSNTHSYPPLVQDPHTAYLEQLVQARLEEVKTEYAKELASREAAYQQREKEHIEYRDALQAHVNELSTKLASLTAVSQESRLPDDDTTMQPVDSHPVNQPSVPKVQKARRRARIPPPPVPASAPSRNLRSMTRINANPSTSTDPTPPVLPTEQSRPKSKVAVAAPSRQCETIPGASTASPPNANLNKTPKLKPHRVVLSQLPRDIGGLKNAMFLHIRILWTLKNAKEIPGDPPANLLFTFNRHFSTEQQLLDARNGRVLIQPSIVQVGTSIPFTDKSRSAKQIRQVEEHILDYVQGYIAKFGLVQWSPDLRQSSYSLYNSACRIIALDTFKQAIVSHAYDFLRPNPVYIRDMGLLIKVYDHVVHFFFLTRYNRECMAPGTVRAKDDANPGYRNRQRLADARLKFIKRNGYPQRYWRLIQPRATSDDEADPNGTKVGNQVVHWIKRRPERSPEMETFIRRLEHERKHEATQDPSRHWRERLRMVPSSDQKDTAFPALPLNMPIDYFLPSSFNNLQRHLRRRAATSQIALLPDATLSFTQHPDEMLTDHDFNNKYGRDVLKKYKLGDLDIFEDEDEEDGDWMDDDFEMEDTEMSEGINGDDVEDAETAVKRSELAAGLSIESV